MSNDKIEKVSPGPPAVPKFLADVHGHEGFDQMDRADVVLPRLVICQSMTPQRKRTSPNFIEGLEDGQLFNSVSGRIYGREVDLVPLLFSKSRIWFKPLAEGGGILCQSLNAIDGGRVAATCAACPNSKFGEKGESPICNLFYNYPAIVVADRELIVVSLKSTGLKAGRAWNSRMKLLGDKPMFSAVYRIQVLEQTNTKGTFFSPVIRLQRFVAEEEFNFARATFEGIRGKTIAADDTGLAEEDPTDESAPF